MINLYIFSDSTTTSGSSHSAFSSMSTIDQVNPTKKTSFKDSRYSSHSATTHTPDLFDEYGLDEPISR